MIPPAPGSPEARALAREAQALLLAKVQCERCGRWFEPAEHGPLPRTCSDACYRALRRVERHPAVPVLPGRRVAELPAHELPAHELPGLDIAHGLAALWEQMDEGEALITGRPATARYSRFPDPDEGATSPDVYTHMQSARGP